MKKLLSLFLLPAFANASSCCGGGSSSSLIILGDNRTEFGFGISKRSDFGQTNSTGYSYLNGNQITDLKNTINLEMKHSFADYWQTAIKLGIAEKHIIKNNLDEKHTGLADFETQLSFEYMPEFNYDLIRPRGFIYSKFTIPFSKSIYDSNSAIQSDVLGNGFYTYSLGTLFVKKINDFQLKLSLELIHYFNRSFQNIKISDSNNFIIPVGISYAIPHSDFTIGASNSFNYSSSKKIKTEINTTTNTGRFIDTTLFINYSREGQSTYSLSYSDSSLIGESINSTLYRIVNLNYTYNIPL